MDKLERLKHHYLLRLRKATEELETVKAELQHLEEVEAAMNALDEYQTMQQCEGKAQ